MGEHLQLVMALVTIMAIFDGLSLYANRFIVGKAVSGQKDQYKDQLKAAADECTRVANQANSVHSVERQLLELKADLPVSYVRKEDFIRYEVIVNTKLDRIHDQQEKLYTTLTATAQKKGGDC